MDWQNAGDDNQPWSFKRTDSPNSRSSYQSSRIPGPALDSGERGAILRNIELPIIV